MTTNSLISIVAMYPLEVLMVKHIIEEQGIRTEEQLVAAVSFASQPMRVALQNAYRDIYVSRIYKLESIPLIFK